MVSAAIDACCLIDLLASGQAEAILQAAGYEWYLPSAVEGEAKYLRQPDPAQPGQFLLVPIDVSALKGSGLLRVCAPNDEKELDRYVHFATLFKSDGEAMCIALAEQRKWHVATDDRKAIRIASQAGVTVISCPELVKAWVAATNPDQATVLAALQNIQDLAQFRPNAAMPEYQWWVDQFPKT